VDIADAVGDFFISDSDPLHLVETQLFAPPKKRVCARAPAAPTRAES
jgi:hypothetical protein